MSAPASPASSPSAATAATAATTSSVTSAGGKDRTASAAGQGKGVGGPETAVKADAGGGGTSLLEDLMGGLSLPGFSGADAAHTHSGLDADSVRSLVR